MKRYLEVFKDLEEKIIRGFYAANTFLPSEADLRRPYNVSRDTIRRALGMLMDSGYIQKIQGKGSIVLKREQLNFPVSGLTSYQELQDAQGFTSTTKVIKLEKLTLNPDDETRTGLPAGKEAWHLIRQRNINQTAVVLDEDFLLANHIPVLPLTVAENSIYEYIENELQLEISYAEKEITIDHLSEVDNQYLDLSVHDINVVSVKSRVFLADATQFQFTESRHQVDKFRFVDFARRQPIHAQ